MNTTPPARRGRPVVGIVGSRGAYGRWLSRFFQRTMGLEVIGRDPVGDTRLEARELIEAADILLFAAPIRSTVSVIDDYVALANGIERGRLWLDVTSIKQAPVEALLRSRADVAGLHPMAAPPKLETLKGRVMAVCPARVTSWRPWLDDFLAATQAECVEVDPAHHDRAMALVQGLVHAGHMAQARVLRELAPDIGGLPALHPLRTVGFGLDIAVTERMLAGNPGIYEDIQFDNPHVLPMLERLLASVEALRDCVREGGPHARARLRRDLLSDSSTFFGAKALAAGSHAFERMGYLMADLEAPEYLSVFLPEDRPGSLRVLLGIFERHGVNLDSIHSSRSPEGELHFRIGIGQAQARRLAPDTWQALCADIQEEGVGRIVGGSRPAGTSG